MMITGHPLVFHQNTGIKAGNNILGVKNGKTKNH